MKFQDLKLSIKNSVPFILQRKVLARRIVKKVYGGGGIRRGRGVRLQGRAFLIKPSQPNGLKAEHLVLRLRSEFIHELPRINCPRFSKAHFLMQIIFLRFVLAV